MTAHPFNLVGSFDDLRDRMVVQVELDRRTGEVLSITGDRDAIRQTCSFLLEAVGTQGTRHGLDHGDGNRPVHGLGASKAFGNGPLRDTATNNTEAAFVGTASTGRLSDQEVRDRARPANILAALRRERELPQAATRFVEHECERELRSNTTSHQTSAQDRELLRLVDTRDERTMECAPFDARANSDARSGGHGSAAGPGTGITDLGLPSHEDHCELVSRRDALDGDALDAFPPRSPGEGHLARGFLGDLGATVGLEFDPGDSPVGGDSVGSVDTFDALGRTDAGIDADTVGNAAADMAAMEGFDGSPSNQVRGSGRDRSGMCGRSRRNFVTGRGGTLRLVPQALHAPATNTRNTDEEGPGS